MRKCIISLLAVLLGCCGCSVKSDRTSCPSLLFLSVCGGEESDYRVEISEGDFRKVMHIYSLKGVAQTGIEVERNRTYRVCVTGRTGLNQVEQIELGEEMPEFYAFVGDIACDSDVEELTADLNKHFARLYISVTGLDCNVRVRGNVCGIKGEDLSPVGGLYCTQSQPFLVMDGNVRRFLVNVPRQIDNSLMMELIPDDGHMPFYSFRIGETIAAMGMDWTKPSLEDICVDIEYVDNTVAVGVEPWQKIEL